MNIQHQVSLSLINLRSYVL